MFLLLVAFLPLSLCAICPKDEFYPVNNKTDFFLPKLPYTYNALNPIYWDQLLYYHHTQVHQALVASLNSIVHSTPAYMSLSLTDLLQTKAQADYSLWRAAGGHYSHSLFWWVLVAYPCSKAPSGSLLLAINAQWGSFDTFQTTFSQTANALFGSGWIFLCVDDSGQLVIKAKAEEFSPLAEGVYPFLALDMWEHAYYFYYMWDKAAYVQAWWNIVDWGMVQYFYDEYASQKLPVPV
jgi:superoxide dismutase, Fe-Mn family